MESFFVPPSILMIFLPLQLEIVNDDLKAAKEANERAPTKTMKSLVERLRNQLALKDKQQKVIDLYTNESILINKCFL